MRLTTSPAMRRLETGTRKVTMMLIILPLQMYVGDMKKVITDACLVLVVSLSKFLQYNLRIFGQSLV